MPRHRSRRIRRFPADSDSLEPRYSLNLGIDWPTPTAIIYSDPTAPPEPAPGPYPGEGGPVGNPTPVPGGPVGPGISVMFAKFSRV